MGSEKTETDFRMTDAEILGLTMVKGIGKKSLLVLARSGLSINDLRSLNNASLRRYIKGTHKDEAIFTLKDRFESILKKAKERIEDLRSKGIEFISFVNKKYPKTFFQLNNLPPFIYLKGNLSLLSSEKNIAIVGTRKCSRHGIQIAKRTAKYFSNAKYNIVSGLAKGIDTAAHEGALKGKGWTTAIVVDVSKIYPKENQKLAEEILEKEGLILAENAPGDFIHRKSFVNRDRLQSALSLGIFVIEADLTGGTSHTVRFAKELGRLIFYPDLSKLNLREEMKTGLIKELMKNNLANPYSKDKYEEILLTLQKKQIELFSSETNYEGYNF